ncbi:MAG: MBL fold metallo-hydrolase [Euryarchaeota archaeon]|nr:MBL fold metallo-hydrolase [Euryarchaeota archaeon]NDB93053.1 MBL fold metallo-hydrolase [Euryarchaeota archaeon]NDF21995.1 MBL fold metallo-hydrolase [Euryarchaeota archaeon]NDF36260.1 MBL fold metallo-hydrolase [Euryarchaeota archaeon]NDG21123.1 MBL fold metallo-hydrolase [Euryarchaeota archaeon]
MQGYSSRTPREPRLASSAVITRLIEGEGKMLMGLRHPEVPTFPGFWAFPGGGVSRHDREYAEGEHSAVNEKDGAWLVALFRELTEETGFAFEADGQWGLVSDDLRDGLCNKGLIWAHAVEQGLFSVDFGLASLVTERTTPPLAPVRYTNRFYHIDFGNFALEPKQPPGRSEFTRFKWWAPEELLSEWEKGEAKMAPPQVTFVRDIIKGMVEGKGMIESLSEMSELPPRGPHKIEFAPGVECLPIPTATLPPATHTNCFIIGRGAEVLVVDPAVQNQEGFEILERRLSELREDGKTLRGALYTHRHPDHIGDQTMVRRLIDQQIFGTAETIEELGAGTLIRDGQTIDLSDGHPWTVIETPGHCPGMVSLASGVGTISADNVTMVGTILVPSKEGSMTQYMESLQRLMAIDPKLLFPSHGPVCASPWRLLDRTYKHRQQRHEKVLEAIQEGNTRLADIAKEAYKDAPDAPIMLSEDQTLSHIMGLIEQGLVAKSAEGYRPTNH